MAIEMEEIEFKDFQEPSVGAENLNKMQRNFKTALNNLDENKQNKLTAGENITIDENGVISATDTNTTYTAGENITIDENGVISAIGGGSSLEIATQTITGSVTVDSYKRGAGQIGTLSTPTGHTFLGLLVKNCTNTTTSTFCNCYINGNTVYGFIDNSNGGGKVTCSITCTALFVKN